MVRGLYLEVSVRLGLQEGTRHTDYLERAARRGLHRVPTCGRAGDAEPEEGESGAGPDLEAVLHEEGRAGGPPVVGSSDALMGRSGRPRSKSERDVRLFPAPTRCYTL